MRRSLQLNRPLRGVGLLLVVCVVLPAFAQQLRGFTLRVVDGRNGRAVQGETIQLWYDEQQGNPILLKTGKDGTVQVPAPMSVAERVLLIPTESIDCRKPRKEDPSTAYLLAHVFEAGVAAENRCGTPAVRKKSGELVLFVRDRRWYDGGINGNTP